MHMTMTTLMILKQRGLNKDRQISSFRKRIKAPALHGSCTKKMVKITPRKYHFDRNFHIINTIVSYL